jgi:formate/nitrite transporter FocA (FNT family)
LPTSAFTQVNPGLQKLVSAAFGLQYGLIMVIVCGAELFTGNTALMTAAFWEGKATAGQVVKNLVCSYAGEPQLAGNLPPSRLCVDNPVGAPW